MTTPANEIPPISEANPNSLSEKMNLKIEGNQNVQASSSLGQTNLTDDELSSFPGDERLDSSNNENQDANSDDEPLEEQTSTGISSKKKRYHRHTHYQIQQMKLFYKKCPHPNDKQRRDLGLELGLDPLQVKFWFQNRRTHLKAKLERNENLQLRARNEKLRNENTILKQSISNPKCGNCRNSIVDDTSSEEQQLKLENVRLMKEIKRLTTMAKYVVGKIGMYSTLSLSPNHDSLEFWAKILEEEFDNNTCGEICSLNSLREQSISVLIQHALSAVEEVVGMAQVGEPLWIPDLRYNKLKLNEHEYLKTFQKGFARKQIGFISEASQECAIVMMSPLNVVEMFMDLNKWLGVFSGMITKAKLYELISTGATRSYNGAMQMISAEFRALSLVVPTRECDFLRYCKRLNDETWILVDVSVDPLLFRSLMPQCRKKPSGCVIQAVSNGCSKITWVEHVEVPDQIIHSLSRSIINSGDAYGAKRWVSFMKRQCERIACATGITNYPLYIQDLNKIALANPEGKHNFLKLAERMVLNFYGGVTASSSVYNWALVSGNGVNEVRIMIRNIIEDPRKLGGVVLCASTCFWIPILPKIVFDYLRNANNRTEWDILSNGGVVQEIAHTDNGQETGNCITLLHVTNVDANQGDTLILQESSTESTSSFIVYAPVDTPTINALFGGNGDSESVKLLSSGFTILPSEPPEFKGEIDDNIFISGTLLSITFQILVDANPYAKLSVSSLSFVSNLIESTSMKIKFALGEQL